MSLDLRWDSGLKATRTATLKVDSKTPNDRTFSSKHLEKASHPVNDGRFQLHAQSKS